MLKTTPLAIPNTFTSIMKKLFTIFIISVVGVGFYHLYTTNPDFKKSVNGFYEKYANKKDINDEKLGIKSTHKSSQKKKIFQKKSKTLIPDQFFALDKYAKNCPVKYHKDIPSLVEYLLKPANTEIEKVRVLFTWIATHIRYDDIAYNTKKYPDYTPGYVLSK